MGWRASTDLKSTVRFFAETLGLSLKYFSTEGTWKDSRFNALKAKRSQINAKIVA